MGGSCTGVLYETYWNSSAARVAASTRRPNWTTRADFGQGDPQRRVVLLCSAVPQSFAWGLADGYARMLLLFDQYLYAWPRCCCKNRAPSSTDRSWSFLFSSILGAAQGISTAPEIDAQMVNRRERNHFKGRGLPWYEVLTTGAPEATLAGMFHRSNM